MAYWTRRSVVERRAGHGCQLSGGYKRIIHLYRFFSRDSKCVFKYVGFVKRRKVEVGVICQIQNSWTVGDRVVFYVKRIVVGPAVCDCDVKFAGIPFVEVM